MAGYDDNNIFARILRGDLPCNKVHETDHALAFHDINPQAPVHVLVIPKGKFVSMDDFARNASPDEIAGLCTGYWRTMAPMPIRRCFTCISISSAAGRWAPCWKAVTCRPTAAIPDSRSARRTWHKPSRSPKSRAPPLSWRAR
jgi:hypothetical protein